MVASHIFLFKTPWGLRLRAAGESTEALAAPEFKRAKWQYLGILLSGLLAGTGGCFLASEVHYFTKGMTAGRGYLALAAVIFGNWRPLSGVSACFLFGFATAFELANRWNIPGQLLHSLPYILTMVVRGRVRRDLAPTRGLGKDKVVGPLNNPAAYTTLQSLFGFGVFIRKSVVAAVATVITIRLGVLRIDHITKHTDTFRWEGFRQMPYAL